VKITFDIELIVCVWCTAESSEDSKPPRMSDTELAQMVDGILEDNDGNSDGFIDYAEFLLSQRQL